jgi:hypothetical protein
MIKINYKSSDSQAELTPNEETTLILHAETLLDEDMGFKDLSKFKLKSSGPINFSGIIKSIAAIVMHLGDRIADE